MKRVSLVVVPGIFAVNCHATFWEMIAAGRYDWVSPDITPQRFPVPTVGKVYYEPKLFYYDYAVTSSNDISRLVREDDLVNPWESAKIEHLLAYGATYPTEPVKRAIVGLGAVTGFGANRRQVCIDRRGSNRILRLADKADGKNVHLYCFLVVRKVPKPVL